MRHAHGGNVEESCGTGLGWDGKLKSKRVCLLLSVGSEGGGSGRWEVVWRGGGWGVAYRKSTSLPQSADQ